MISIIGELKPPPLLTLQMSDELRGYVEIRPEHGQPVNFLAVLAGVKPVMDDWVPGTRLGEFTDMCRAQGLTVLADVQFQALADQDAVDRVIGRGTLTTTRANGHRLGEKVADASVHVFVGRDRSLVERTRASGWYPLIIGGRANNKPWIDHFWFGQGLGYPPCCLEAFARSNNWSVNNMPYQAFRAVQRKPSMLCNSLMRFTGLTWAAHLPCSYDCPATAGSAVRIRGLVTEHCQPLASLIDRLAAAPYLVLNEWEAFAFTSARVTPTGFAYSGVTIAPSNRPNLTLFDALRRGTRLELRDDLVVIFDATGEVVHVEQTRTDGFAPRIPFILDFSA
jgi:hypothetical protein